MGLKWKNAVSYGNPLSASHQPGTVRL